jgi:hypothetical protein
MGMGVLGPERESRGGCRELHNEELHDLYSLATTVMVIKPRVMRWMGAYSMHGEEETCKQNFGLKT